MIDFASAKAIGAMREGEGQSLERSGGWNRPGPSFAVARIFQRGSFAP